MESERFGPYTVYECLGAGGMATVHRASIELENDDHREVALKRLLPQYADDKRFVEDFIREAKLAAQLDHPNIVRILELGRIGRTYFIAMDLVLGRSVMTLLRRAHQRRQPAPVGVVVGLALELCDALAHAHAANIVHRDLTPSNLIVTDDGHLKIIDFGVAKALVGDLRTSSGLAKGKLGYMSIEAISGKQLDTRADIFSTGVVLWELLATKRLFKGKNEYEILQQIHEADLEPPSRHNREVPEELDDLVLKALARAKEDRYQTAKELRAAIAELRRYFARTSPEDVVRWVAKLRGDTVPTRSDSEAESTAMRLSTEDVFEETELADSVEMAAGSQRAAHYARGSSVGTYDDVETTGVSETPPVEESSERGSKPKFMDADTQVSSYYDRKR